MFQKKLIYDINNWLDYIKITCKQSTYSNYEYIVNNRIKPTIGNLYKRNINNKFINTYTLNLIDKGLSPKTIKDTLTVLNQILKYANIKVKASCPKVSPQKIKILSSKEQKKLEQYLITNLNARNIGILLSLYTGLRIGEVCALKYKNIDFNKKIIKVENTLIRVKNKDTNGSSKTVVILEPPKTINSIREIPISNVLLSYLSNLRKNDDCFIITGNKYFIEPRNYANYYKKVLKELNINSYNFHALRHTFATRCIEIGSDPKTLSEILGHANIRITLDRYVHPNNTTKKKLLNKISLMY